MKRRLCLRTRYAFLLSVLLALAAVLVSGVHLFDAWRTERAMQASSSEAMQRALREQVEEAGRGLAMMLSDSVIEPLSEDDFERLYNIMSSARRLPSINDVLLYDASGIVVHDGTEEILAYGQRATPALLEEVLRDGRWLKTGRDGVLMITSPISVDEQRLGALYLEIDLSRSLGHINELDAELKQITASGFRESVIVTVIITTLLCLGGIVIARAVATRLSSPILELESLTKRIGAGDYQARVPWRRSDELGELSESLHQMAETLQETTVSKTELEELILRRTKELGLANRELRRLDKSRRQFIAEVSHELRTPLTAILGEAQVTLRNRHPKSSDYRAALESIVKLSKQVAKLIDDLLFIARSQTAVLPLDTKPLDFSRLVNSVCVEMKGLFRNRETEIKVEVGDDRAHINGDELRLRQLLMILLDNALKYHDGSGPIAVGLRQAEHQAVLIIRNTGDGVTAEELAHVFDPFYRGNQAQRHGASGSGLGLAVAKRIVEAHKGTIAVASTPGRDTLVTVQLPIAMAPADRIKKPGRRATARLNALGGA